MILTSNRCFAEWSEILGDPVVATALLDRLLRYVVIVQIEGASYSLRSHADLIPAHVRTNAPITPPLPKRRRGRPPKNGRTEIPQPENRRSKSRVFSVGNFATFSVGIYRRAPA